MANQIKYQVGFDVDKSSLNQIKTSLQQLSRVKLSDIMKINGTDAQGAREILADIKEKAQQVEQALTKAFNTKLNTANIQEFKNQLKSLNIQDLYSSFSKAGAAGEVAFRQVSTQLMSTNIQLKESNTLLNKMGTTFLNTIKWNIASSAINAMSRSIQQAWGFTKDLDTSLNDIRIVTGKSADEMANFATQANKAAQNLGQTTTNYTKASLIYYQQGLQDAEVQARTDVTLKAANVTGQSAQQVSEQLTAVWNGYKVSAEQTEVYIDRLAAVAATSASNLEELSTGMSKVASAAAAMGVGEEQLAAQLSTIISVTRQAPQSVGTALRTIFARVADIKAGLDQDGVTLGNYSSKMAELGINVLDMNGNLRDMGEVMEQIGAKWGDMSREQQVYLARTMAGQRQYNNLLALFDNFEMYNKELAVAQNATGTLQKQQDTYMESTEAHLKQLRAALEGVYEKAINTKSINSLIDGLKMATNFMAQFVQSLGGGGAALSSLGSIAFMVFSKQIGASLATTINNMKIAREQTEFFKKAMAEAQQLQKINTNNTYSKELLADQSKMMTLAAGGALTPESFNQIKESLLEFRDIADNLDIVKEKAASIQQAFDNTSPSVANLIKQMGGLNEVLSDSGKMNMVQEQIQKVATAFEPFKDKINETKDLWNDLVKNTFGKDLTIGENLDKAAASAENLRNSLVSTVKNLKSTTIDGGTLFSSLPEAAQKTINEVNSKLATIKIDRTNFEFSSNDIKNLYDELVRSLENKKNELETSLGHTNIDSPEWISLQEKIQALSKALEEAKMKKDNFLQSGTNTAMVQQFMSIASSVTSLAMAVNNLKNLGSIWTNEDLSAGEKLLQTITNLGMAIGMIIPAYQKLNAVYIAHASTVTFLGTQMSEETALKVKNIITTAIQGEEDQELAKIEAELALSAAVAKGAIDEETAAKIRATIATKGAEAANQSLKKSLLSNPYTAIAIAIMAAVVALSALAKAQEEVRKTAIDIDNTNIEKENQIQEQIKSNQELCNSLQELDEQYEQGEISRYDLKSAVQDLIDQYGLEGKAADDLANSYDNLGKYLSNTRKEMALTAQASARRELKDVEDKLVKEVNASGLTVGQRWGSDLQDESVAIQEIFEKNGFYHDENNAMASGYSLEFSKDPASIAAAFDIVNKTIDDIQALPESVYSVAQRTSDIYYQDLIKWRDEHKETIEQYKAAQQDLQKYSTSVAAITGSSDLDNIKTVNQYYAQRKQLITDIQAELDKNNDKTADAAAMADTYLAENYRNIYAQFDDATKFLDKFKEANQDVSDETINKITEKFANLDSEHMFAVMDASQYATSWSQLEAIIDRLASKDLSNIGNVFGRDIENMKANAAEVYKLYQDIYDKVDKGETISTEDYQGLPEQLQNMFTMAADGTYKMIESFKEFETVVNNLKFDGFRKNLADAYNTQDIVNNVSNFQNMGKGLLTPDELVGQHTGAITVQDVDESGNKQEAIIGYEKEINAQRLKYLQLVNQGNDAELESIRNLQDKNNANLLTLQQQKEILDKIQAAKDEIDNIDLNQLNSEIEEMQHQLFDAMFPTDEDVDTEALSSLTDVLQSIAKFDNDVEDANMRLADSLEEDTRAAEDVAEAILRFDDAIQDVVDNYDDWMDALQNGSMQDQAEVMDGLRDAYADLLDLDGSALSKQFLLNADNLDLMKAAIDGDIDAYNQLMELAGQDILMGLGLNDEEALAKFQQDLAWLQSYDSSVFGNIADLEVGASLNDQAFLDELTNMVNSAHMTAQQATDYLASMGVDAEVIQQDTTADETNQNIEWENQITATPVTRSNRVLSMEGATPAVQTVDTQVWEYNQSVKAKPVTETAKKESKSFALKVTSANKSSGGGFKFSQAKNGGGSSGAARRSGGSGGGGGKGGGGGSSKAAEPDKSQKDTKKPMEDTRDIYHDINIEIERINRNLDRVQKKQDRLYGQQLLNNLNKQTAILEQHKDKLKEKQKLQEEDLANQRKELESLGVIFDKYGNINNYMAILAQKQADINSLTNHYNDIISEYNKSTDKDQKKLIADDAEAVNKQLKELEDEYKDLEEKIKDYDSLREDMEDLVDEIEEETQKQIELNIQKFRMELEIRLDMGEAERDWNEFRRRVLDKTDVIKDTNFDSIFQDALQNINDIYSYFDVGGSRGAIQTLTQQLIRTKEEIEAIDEIGESAIYGDNKAQAMEDLKNDLDELMSQMEDMEDLIDAVDEAYLDTIDDIADQFDKQIEDYEFIGELLEHDMDLLTLLYGDKNYDAMERYYTALAENNNKQLDFLRQQAAYWKENWEAATAAGDIQAAKEFEEHYKDTISNLSDVIEESAQNLQDKYLNAIDKIFDALDQKITNGKGLDYLDMEWELVNKNADEYLDTINSAFAVQELQNKFQKAIDDTKNIKNQQTLKKLMDEQLNNLRTKEKLTEYDVQRAEKLLQIEQARMALEDAKSSKTTMRLKRNAQGNYSYEYVANGEGISDAQDALAAAQNDLYNFDKDRYRSNLDDMLAAWKDFQSKYKDIVTDTSLTEQQKVEKTALLREQYGQYINDKTAENLVIRNNLMESAFADLAALYEVDVANYNQMSIDEQNILMNDLIPTWKGGIQQMTDAVAGAGGFIPTCQEAFDDIHQATKNYERELDNMARIAGVDFNLVKQGISDTSTELSQLIEENDDLINSMKTEMDTISQLRTAVQNFVTDYNNVYDAAKQTVTAIQDFTREQEKAAAAAKNLKQQVEAVAEATKKANATSSSSSYTAPTASSSGGGSGGGSGGSGGGSGGSGGGSSNNISTGKTQTPAQICAELGHKFGATVETWRANGWRGCKRTCTRCGYVQTWDEKLPQTSSGSGGKRTMMTYDTGGYTGNWNTTDGQLAILHQKELVLNQTDTQNVLDSVNILRSLLNSSNDSIMNKITTLNDSNRYSTIQNLWKDNDNIDQAVHIDASFPNVNSKKEIEDAFNELINLAAQRALKR